jgi:perosamine synthetase
MPRPITISLSPNAQPDDVALARRRLFDRARWFDQSEVEALEREFAALFGAEYTALAVNSGRSGQWTILKALGYGVGDQVAVQSFTCVAVPNSVIWLGASPVYVDIDATYNLTAETLRARITPQTRAVIVQHTFGILADLEPIRALCDERGLVLIEDCCHGLGARYRGKPIGSFGKAAFFSFGRDKILSSVFGGMIITADREFARQLRAERDALPDVPARWVAQQLFHPIAFDLILPTYNSGVGKAALVALQKAGLVSKAVYDAERFGQQPRVFPAKMPGALAALARHQLQKLDKFNAHRAMLAQKYADALKNTALILPPHVEGASWLRYPVRHPDADGLFQYAKARGILLGDWYRSPITPATALLAVKYEMGSCPTAEEYARTVINLPTAPTISAAQADKVIEVVHAWLNTK